MPVKVKTTLVGCLKANVSKSKFVSIRPKKSGTKILQDAEYKPIKLGSHKSEKSTAKKKDKGILKGRMPLAMKKCDEILKIRYDPRLMGFPTVIGPIGDYE